MALKGGVRFYLSALNQDLEEQRWCKKRTLIDLHLRSLLRHVGTRAGLRLDDNELVLSHPDGLRRLRLDAESQDYILTLCQDGTEPMEYKDVVHVATLLKEQLQRLIGGDIETEVFAFL